MKVLGIKISSNRVNDPKGWSGYWKCRTDGGFNIGESSTIVRTNQFDAEVDALLNAKSYAKQNGVTFITEGYTI